MFLLRLLVVAFFFALVGIVVAPAVLLYKGLQPEPLVQSFVSVRQEDVARIKALLREHDPRSMNDGETRTVTVSERDLNLALHSVLPLADRQSSRISLGVAAGTLEYTLRLPANPLGDYLNVSLLVGEQDGTLALDRVQLGELNLPGWALMPLVMLADSRLKSSFEEYRGAREALQGVSLDSGEVGFTYRWDKALAKQIEQRGREVLLPAADRERTVAYYQVLAGVSRNVNGSTSLDRLLQPLFEAAVQRSGDGDAAAENRALLLVLGTVLNRSSIQRLVGGDPADLAPGHRYVQWTLNGRGDLAQHFSISAAIATAGGGVLADAVGVFKELDDSRGGSGFSFPDLLADRAGVELAAAATGADAQRIQRIMATEYLRESDFMPAVNLLPEGLMEMEFKQRYRDLDDARYANVKREIDSRVARLPVYN
jgi:hypothetical protein